MMQGKTNAKTIPLLRSDCIKRFFITSPFLSKTGTVSREFFALKLLKPSRLNPPEN
jgi:hypothetical protein